MAEKYNWINKNEEFDEDDKREIESYLSLISMYTGQEDDNICDDLRNDFEQLWIKLARVFDNI